MLLADSQKINRIQTLSSAAAAAIDKKAELKLIVYLANQIQHSDDPDVLLNSATDLCKLVQRDHRPPMKRVLDTGIVPRLVQLLTPRVVCERLQYQVAWILCNLASRLSGSYIDTIVNYGTVETCLELLVTSKSDDLRHQLVWAMSNIAGESSNHRDTVLKCGGMERLLPLIPRWMDNPQTIECLRTGTWTLINLTRGHPLPDYSVVSTALPTIALILSRTSDTQVLENVCWTLEHLTEDDDDAKGNLKATAVIEAGICPHLLALLDHNHHTHVKLQSAALRVIDKIVSGANPHHTTTVVNLGLIPRLAAILSSPTKDGAIMSASSCKLMREACWVVSNLTAEGPGRIQDVMDAHLIPSIVNLIKSSLIPEKEQGTEKDTKSARHKKYEKDMHKQAIWALCNAADDANNNQLRYLIDQGVVECMCSMLVASSSDPDILLKILAGLKTLLLFDKRTSPSCTRSVEWCSGLDKVKALQQHESHAVSSTVSALVSTTLN